MTNNNDYNFSSGFCRPDFFEFTESMSNSLLSFETENNRQFQKFKVVLISKTEIGKKNSFSFSKRYQIVSNSPFNFNLASWIKLRHSFN